MPPGHSQHHAGIAVDLGTPGNATLLEDFEQTPAFLWLHAHAHEFGFSLTYPRGNSSGLAYEPWHWAYTRAKHTTTAEVEPAGTAPFTAISRRFHARLHG
jgi:LAS superfamily LD-carboxypeptidase LdcB